MVQSGPEKTVSPGSMGDPDPPLFGLRRSELLEMLKHAGILLVVVFSVSSLYALACLPPAELEHESIRQPVDIAAPPGPVRSESGDVMSADSSSRSTPTLPGIARPRGSDLSARPRRVLLGIETRVERLAEILPDRYPGKMR